MPRRKWSEDEIEVAKGINHEFFGKYVPNILSQENAIENLERVFELSNFSEIQKLIRFVKETDSKHDQPNYLVLVSPDSEEDELTAQLWTLLMRYGATTASERQDAYFAATGFKFSKSAQAIDAFEAEEVSPFRGLIRGARCIRNAFGRLTKFGL